MAAYIVVNVDVRDPERYEDYKKAASASIDAFGGRFLARGGRVEVLEGDWTPQRFVIVQFPDVAQAKAWWASAEYAGAKTLRQQTAHSDLIVVEGV